MKNKVNCCGCEACRVSCPFNCISMIKDEEGFLYPVINKELCIKCGKCDTVCPIISKEKLIDDEEIYVYAGKDKNDINRMESTSGGVFGVVAEYFLKNDGIVFGAAFNNKFEVEHIKIDKISRLSSLRGSKYVQSKINDSYIKVKNYLKSDKLVLFSGVPCQVYGLYKFLGKNYNNLYTCAIVCHGVPSPEVFSKYKYYLEKKYKSKIIDIKFRNKINGWEKSEFTVTFKNGKVYSNEVGKDLYTNSFQCDLYSRPSCHECKFKELPNKADFLLGDFWGIESEKEHFYDKKGVSLIITNEKGNNLLSILSDKLIIEKANIEHALKRNPYIIKSPAKSEKRDEFMIEYAEKKEFKYLIKKYMKPLRSTITNRIINKIYRIIK